MYQYREVQRKKCFSFFVSTFLILALFLPIHSKTYTFDLNKEKLAPQHDIPLFDLTSSLTKSFVDKMRLSEHLNECSLAEVLFPQIDSTESFFYTVCDRVIIFFKNRVKIMTEAPEKQRIFKAQALTYLDWMFLKELIKEESRDSSPGEKAKKLWNKYYVELIAESQEDKYKKLRKKLIQQGYYSAKDLLKVKSAENFIGSGDYKKVYKIPGIPEYVLAITERHIMISYMDRHIEIMPNSFPDLNVGQAVARIGQTAYILKKVDGVPTGFNWQNNKMSIDDKKDDFFRRFRVIASMPQAAYTNLAFLIVRLNENGFRLDPGSGNILVDSEKGVFNIIDLIGCFYINNKNTLFDFLYSLQIIRIAPYANSYKDQNIKGLIRQALIKSLIACQLAGVPMRAKDSAEIELLFKLVDMNYQFPLPQALLLDADSRRLVQAAL